MNFAVVQINGVCAHTVFAKKIPAGIIGAQIRLEFDEGWDALTKTAVFRAVREDQVITKDVIITENVVPIPAETTEKPCKRLSVGVYGTNADGSIVIPTLWADLGRVCYAADPSGDESTDPTLPVWAQIAAQIEKMGGGKLIADVETWEETDTGGNGGAAHKLTVTYTDGAQTVMEWHDGYNGADGADGKTAYEYAVDGGYAGSEEDFAAKLAAEGILCVPQTLTEEQKAQARENIGAGTSSITSYQDLEDQPIPDASVVTEGAFLRAVGGAWTAAVLDNAEEASF